MKHRAINIGIGLFVFLGSFHFALAQIYDISVNPRNHNFRKVKLGAEKSVSISISTTGRGGGIEIEDYSFTPNSSPDFHITATPFSSAISAGRAAYIEITFEPTSPGLHIATLSISFRQGMEAFHFPVNFKGFGEGSTPRDLVKEIQVFVDNSIQEGTLVGLGEGAVAQRRLKDFKEQIRIAIMFLKNGIKEEACRLFQDAILKMDGESSTENPPDFVQGEATSELIKMISDFRKVLSCDDG
jgi:hypothetical protein